MANAKTNTPIPPTKCVKLLQNKREFSKTSTFVNILAPVVVNPLTVSKKASINEGILLLNTKGRAPKSDNAIHETDTMTRPSLAYIF